MGNARSPYHSVGSGAAGGRLDAAAVVSLLLTSPPELGIRADVQDGGALVNAVTAGREDIVRMLLEDKRHAPPANAQGGKVSTG